jgi:hypothetical protein
MFTRRFWGWVGVGVLATLAIPTLAAPHVAKLLQRHQQPVRAVKVEKVAKKPATTRAATRPAETSGFRQRLSGEGSASVKIREKRETSARTRKRPR